MAYNIELINNYGQVIATGAEDTIIAAYAVPTGSKLRLSDIVVNSDTATGAWFHVYRAAVRIFSIYIAANAGSVSKSFVSPIEIEGGANVSVTVQGTIADVCNAEYEAELRS